MSPHKYFVQVVEKGKRGVVQEIDPRMFSYLRALPKIDASVNEPNLLTLERYPDNGLYQPTSTVLPFYAGVVKIEGHDLVQSFHYFVEVNPTKLKVLKKKPILVGDHAVVLASQKRPGV